MHSLQDRVATLEDALHDSRERRSALEADKTDLTESLDASRENYRQLMGQINHKHRTPTGADSSAPYATGAGSIPGKDAT